MKSIDKINVKGKKVLVRVDYNVPIDKNGKVLNDIRIKASIKTLKYLVKNGAKVSLITHIGRPNGEYKKIWTTENVSNRLSKLLKLKVTYINEVYGKKLESNLAKQKDNELLMLENVRFYKQEKSKNKIIRNSFGKKIAKNYDIYVNEAFSNSHRNHASMTSIPKYIPSYIGYDLQDEYTSIMKVMKSPNHPFVAIVGGMKADKLNVIENLLKRGDSVLLGGSLAFLFIKAKGINVGHSKIDFEGLKKSDKTIKKLLKNKKLHLPLDAVVAKSINSKKGKRYDVDKLPDNMMALDLGKKTIEYYKKELKKAKTIIWAGPLGAFEYKPFMESTKQIAKFISKTKSISIIGGGDTATAFDKLKLTNKVTHVSLAGGASLELFAGKKLVALESLK